MNNTKKKTGTNKSQRTVLIGSKTLRLFLGFLDSYYPIRKAMYINRFLDGIQVINKMAINRGKRETLTYCKLARLSVTRYLSGNPLPKDTPKIKLNNDGLPQILHAFNPLIRGKDKEDLRIIFTMLNLTRGIILEPIRDFKSITDTSLGSLPNKWHILKGAVKYSLGLKRRKVTFGGLHTSTKSGPLGQSMLFSTMDWINIPDQLKEDLGNLAGPKFKLIIDKLNKVGDGSPLYQIGNDLIKLNPEKGSSIRKLSIFGDKEGKTRVIGILDYGSQSVLKGIHKELENFLRKIPEDCTFDQSVGYTKLPSNVTYYSFDLSNATDRLPVFHQKEIIDIIFGKRVAKLWASILTDYSFTQKGYSHLIKYECGQPMGAYSSGPIMTLQHHAIVHYAALLCGENPKGNYVLLGDDIVIANDKIAKMYQEVIKELGVQISPQKTHVSKDICEFAKRWFYLGSEITAFPLHSIQNNLKRYYLLENSLHDARAKGYNLSEESERGCVIKLIGLSGRKQQAVRTFKLYKLFSLIIDKSMTEEEQIGSIKTYIEANGNIPEDNKEKFFKDENTFRESLDENLQEYFLDLTSEGNNEMMEMMDQSKKGEKACKAISPDLGLDIKTVIPIVSAFGTAGSKRSEILDNYYKQFANDKNKLRASLVLLESLPTISVRIVNTRSSHMISAAHSRLVKMLLEYLIKPEIVYQDDIDWFESFKTIDSKDGNEPF